ncbi:DUF5667 domain-containing protein [Calidifontibacillus erzurumensis]|uniref:DUF5667 domain-containing protein n=1 Tax=Calidifontibacillus erzurumensis TaxID=2741433 RepID=A0A8J8GED4_9BACI|nr:DUF5667 domain-containing protein [Calidifontibacillus erzurumensis]NSL51974.1 hypothetical protein [Calidifontibacillus erzurumensis]
MNSKKKFSKTLSKCMVAAMLTVPFGASVASAEQTAAQENIVKSEIKTEVSESVVLPGDLFYFAKILTEKIKLALANEDLEKAKLLVQFTQDRLHEAELLFKNGDEKLAYETLKKAVELQNKALDYSGQSESGNTVDQSLDKKEHGAKKEDLSKKTKLKNSAEIEAAKKELEEAFSNNVHGLLNAMQHVKNPKALKELTKNLEKQAKQYEKNYGKLLKEEVKYEKKETDESKKGAPHKLKHEKKKQKDERKKLKEEQKQERKLAHEKKKLEKKQKKEERKQEKKNER